MTEENNGVLHCVITETEAKISEYALRKFIEEYTRCDPRFIKLQKKLEKLGYRDDNF